MTSATWNSPLGILYLEEKNGAVTRASFETDFEESAEKSPVLENAILQLKEYFDGKRKEFTVPLCPKGTAFQEKVWAELQRIPYGEMISYGELAQRIGSPKAFRAVGQANHRNPIAILIPCHRVIGADGSLTGYASGLDRKKGLLQLEKSCLERSVL